MKLLFWPLLLCCLLSACDLASGDQHINQGADFYAERNFEAARIELRKALDKPLNMYEDKMLFTLLGNVYNELEKFDSSIVYHQMALDIDPDYLDALVNMGIVYRLLGEFDEAETYYVRAQAINPDDPQLNASLGALYVHTGDLEGALRHLEHAIELDPEFDISHANYAVALAMTGDFDKANSELNRAIALGYHNGPLVQQRIDELKASAE